jgi:hypothetical protein
MFENELGVDKSKGMDSYDDMVTQRAITIDGRFRYRAQRRTGEQGRYSARGPYIPAEEVIWSLPNGFSHMPYSTPGLSVVSMHSCRPFAIREL